MGVVRVYLEFTVIGVKHIRVRIEKRARGQDRGGGMGGRTRFRGQAEPNKE